MIELNQDNLKEVVENQPTVVVQYGATWCGNCRMVKPKFKQMAEETQGVEFVYVDAEKYPESRQLATVNNLPTFAVFQNGQLVKQNQGNRIDIVKELLDEVTRD